MAGIGFELKKLFNEKGLLPSIKAYLYSATVTVGPMFFCIGMISILQQIFLYIGLDYEDRELFYASVMYAFTFSLIVTSGFTMLLSRYVSDKLYSKKEEDVLSSLYGAIALCITVGGILGFIFYYKKPLDLSLKIVTYVLFMELIILWIEMVYVSALKNFKNIAMGFFLGMFFSIVFFFIFVHIFSFSYVVAVILSMDVGFLIIIVSYMLNIQRYFIIEDKKYFEFLKYIPQYWELCLLSFFYTLSLYAHNFVYWYSALRVDVKSTYGYVPIYDVPSFYAFMTILPSMVIFVVKLETSLYDKYKRFYNMILNGGGLEDIKKAKKEMIQVLVDEILYIMEIQLFFSLLFMVVGMKFLPRWGVMGISLDIYSILVLAYYSIIIMNIIMLILLYYDDRKGAFFVAGIFLISNVFFTKITVCLGENYYGTGIFMAGFISLIVALYRLRDFIKNIEYNIFCFQPIFNKTFDNDFTRFIDKIHNM